MKTSRRYAFWFNLATLLLPLKVSAWFDSVLPVFHSGPVVMEGKIDGSDALVRGNQAWLKLESEDNAHSSAGIFQLTLNQETGVVNVTTYSSSSPYPDIIIYPTEPVLPRQKTGLPVVDEAPILFELNETIRLIKEHTGSFRQSNDSEVDYRTTHEADITGPPSQEKQIYKAYKQDPALQPHPVWGVAPNHSDINITLIYEDQSRTTITPSPTTFGQSQSVTFVHQSNTGGTGASPAGSPSPSSEPEPTASGAASAGSESSSQAHATPAASIALQNDNKGEVRSWLKEHYFEAIKKRSSDASTSAEDISMKQLAGLFVLYNIVDETNLSILLQTLCTKECTSRINTLMRESRDSVQQNLTLLYLAAAYNFPDMLKRLLEYGADPNLYEDRYNPLAIAIQRNCSEIIELLLTANTKISPRVYQECFLENDADLARRLFRHQKESLHVSSQEGTGKQNCVRVNEPIIVAAGSGALDFVKLFHQEGCQLNCRDSRGATLLGIAAGHCNLEVMKYLLAHNADTSICLPGSEGGTAMHGAAMVVSPLPLALLLKHMPDIPVNDSGETPLHWSFRYKLTHPAVSCLLLLAGCDPSKENTEQLTAKDLLLKKNVDPSCKRGNWGKICCLLDDKHLLALLQRLIRSPTNYKEILARCPELSSILLSPKEAQQDIPNPNQLTLVNGYTPLHFAVLLGDPKAVWDWTRLGVDLFSYPDDLSFINPVRLARVLGFDDIVMILGVAFSMSGRPCNPSDEDECIAEDKYIAEDKQFLLERYCLTLKNLAAITIFTEYANKKEKIVQYLPTASGKDLLDLPKKLLEKPNPEQQ